MWKLKERWYASGIHLGISLVVAGLTAWLVFGLWYPYPYRDISGGRELFMLVMAVDVVMGPLITLIIFNRTKTRRHLMMDFTVVGLLQVAALSYGIWAVFISRPVHLVFEYHRVAVVHAADVNPSMLALAPPNLRALPLTGPTLLSLRWFIDPKEEYQSTMAALNGLPQAAQPALWQPWEAASSDILRESRPVAELRVRFKAQAALIDGAISSTGRKTEALRYLPLLERRAGWTVLIDGKSSQPVGFLPLDSF